MIVMQWLRPPLQQSVAGPYRVTLVAVATVLSTQPWIGCHCREGTCHRRKVGRLLRKLHGLQRCVMLGPGLSHVSDVLNRHRLLQASMREMPAHGWLSLW